jgi:isohexenylglutaconyl-CoA hydratase
MNAPLASTLALSEQRGVLRVMLQRPQARNAMTLDMVRELSSVFAQAEARDDLRVLVLRGAGGHFCAGADIKDLLRAQAEPVTSAHNPVAETNAAFGHLCAAFAKLSLPTVCVLEGSVLGGGFGLACASDIALAADTALFGLPETSLGVVPAQIAPFLVERLGFSQAKRLALIGGKVDATQALAIGLVHELHASGPALDLALEVLIARLLRCAPQATRATKRLLLRTREQSAESLIEHASLVFSAQLNSSEGAEGTRAFVEKRPPDWQAPRGEG